MHLGRAHGFEMAPAQVLGRKSLVVHWLFLFLTLFQMLINDMAGLTHPVKPPLAFDFDVDVVAMWVNRRLA